MTNRVISSERKLKLFANGEFTQEVTQDIAAQTFVSVGEIDISPLGASEVEVYCSSLIDYTIVPGQTDKYVNIVNMGEFLVMYDGVGGFVTVDGGYQIEGNTVRFGYYNSEDTPITANSPYSTARIFYSIFYY